MPEVLVLGPTGSIGSHLLRLLHENGIGARTGNRRDFDYFSPRTYSPLFRGATHLLLLTPVVDSMVELTSALLTAAKTAGIERVIKVSALGAAPDSSARLMRWHAESEKLVSQSGFSWVNLRPNALMQNFIQHYSAGIRENSAIAVPAGESKISFVDAEDVAKVAFVALFDERLTGRSLDLTGNKAIDFCEAAADLTSALGRNVRYIDVTEEGTRKHLAQRQFPLWKSEALLELYASYRKNEAARVTTTVLEITGKAPGTFKNFINGHAKEFQ